MALSGKTVLVFGGSSGMGKAAAKTVLKLGGIPWIIGRDPQKLESARAEISPTDPSCVRISSVDGNDSEAMSAFFAAVPVGTVHHMVCTWGESARCGDVRGTENFAKLQKQMAIKFDLQMRPVSMGADKLADGGSIVLCSGALSRRPGKGCTALAAANAALEAAGRGLANDLGPRLRVNTISPGLTRTEMWDFIPAAARDAMLREHGESCPLKRCGEANEVGEAIGFLLTAEYVTGTVLDVDGGAVIRP